MARVRIDCDGAPYDFPFDRMWEFDLCAQYSTGISSIPASRQFGVANGMVNDPTLPHVWAPNNNNPQAGPFESLWLSGLLCQNANVTDDPFAATDVEDPAHVGSSAKSIGWWGRVTMMELIGPVVDQADLPSIDMKSGFGLGQSNVVNIPAAPTVPLALIYQRWDVPLWELLVCRGNGTPAAVKALTGVPPPSLFSNNHVRLFYDGVRKRAAAYVNGILGAEIIDADKFPPANLSPALCGGSVFAQSGSTAGAPILSTAYWNIRMRVFA
jgi:hypothetical protein